MGSSSAELLASFCDNALKNGGGEKLSGEAIEEMLETVRKSLSLALLVTLLVHLNLSRPTPLHSGDNAGACTDPSNE